MENKSIEELYNLPTVDIDKKDSGIYLLFNEKELVYVGISENIQLRIISHKGDKVFTKSSVILGDVNDFRFMESLYIFTYTPKYNKTISEDSLFINVRLIKNIQLLSPLSTGFKLINGVIYLNREMITKRGFELVEKWKESGKKNYKYYILK